MLLIGMIPILRIFDVDIAKEFYMDYLGFEIDWEHQFEDGFPLYIQISRDGVTLHLSEHHGDCTPGSAIRIEVKGIRKFHQELNRKQYRYLRPGLEKTPWNSEEVSLTDPFGNRIILYEYSTGE